MYWIVWSMPVRVPVQATPSWISHACRVGIQPFVGVTRPSWSRNPAGTRLRSECSITPDPARLGHCALSSPVDFSRCLVAHLAQKYRSQYCSHFKRSRSIDYFELGSTYNSELFCYCRSDLTPRESKSLLLKVSREL